MHPGPLGLAGSGVTHGPLYVGAQRPGAHAQVFVPGPVEPGHAVTPAPGGQQGTPVGLGPECPQHRPRAAGEDLSGLGDDIQVLRAPAAQVEGNALAACFAGDLPADEQKVVWATHFAPAADLFTHNAPGVAWRSKPSWYIVASNDRTVHPELERAAAKRMGATTYEVDSSHVAMLSHPGLVVDVIRTAASAV